MRVKVPTGSLVALGTVLVPVVLVRPGQAWADTTREQSRPDVEVTADTAAQCANAPTLKAAHLHVEVAMERVLQVKDLFEVAPAKAFCKFLDSGLFCPESREAHHVE